MQRTTFDLLLLISPERLCSLSVWLVITFFIFLLIVGSCGFYSPGSPGSPGLGPVVYCNGEEDSGVCKSDVPIYVNRLDSVESALPYEYSKFDFCPAKSGDESPVENLGQVVFGERIESSPYKATFLEEKKCSVVCKRSYVKGEEKDEQNMQFLRSAITKNYQHHWILDDIPITWCYKTETGGDFCSRGFPVGCHVDKDGKKNDACVLNDKFDERDTFYLFNHVDILVTYNSGEEEEWGAGIGIRRGQIVAATLTPRSIMHRPVAGRGACNTGDVMAIDVELNDTMDIIYSFSISFLEDNKLTWSSRWDSILNSTPIRWSSIMDSLTIVLYLGGSLVIALFRALHRGNAHPNPMESKEPVEKEFRWKWIPRDTFRAPRFALLLSVFLGSGVQIGTTALLLLVAAHLGFLPPASCGTLITYSMVVFVCLASPAGYVSARLYKRLGGQRWLENALLTSLLCPGVAFALVLIAKQIQWTNGSVAAVPFSTLFTLPVPWLLVSTPLVFLGARLGHKRRSLKQTMDTKVVSHRIPIQRLFVNPVPGMDAIMPYCLNCVQLFSILHNIWSQQAYSMPRFVFVVYVLLGLACGVLATFLHCYRREARRTYEIEYRWKLLHGDVFRAPRCGMLLSALLGSGVQIGITAFLTLGVACLGYLSPANPGALVTCPMVLFVCLGTPAGYVSSRFYKLFGGRRFTANAMLTGTLCPGIVLASLFALNGVLWTNDSSAAIPFETLFAFLVPWFLVLLPLVFVGSHLGSTHRPSEQPLLVSEIPRPFPDQRFLTKPIPSFIVGGFLPFTCLWLELFSILTSIWSHQFYDKFFSLSLVLMLVVFLCSELTILMSHIHLCAEDYRWCWRSFVTGGSIAFFVLLYCVVYFFAKLGISGAASTFLYFGYTLIAVFLFSLATGAVGLLSSWWFVSKIFKSTADHWP